MKNHEDFSDEYIQYRIYQECMKNTDNNRQNVGSESRINRFLTKSNPQPVSAGSCCSIWLFAIVCILLLIGLFSMLFKIFGTDESTNTSSRVHRHYYSYSSSSKSYSSNSGYSGSKSKSSSSDPYDAKSYAHPEDLYYDHPDDFWDYEDAEDYWEKHND